MSEIKRGMEDVLALESGICFIDGHKGILEYRGYNIEGLSKVSYEAVAYLLVHGKFPDQEEMEDFSKKLRREREIDRTVLKIFDPNTDAMDALRTGVSCLAHSDKDLHDNSIQASTRKGVRLIAKVPTLVAACYRIKSGKQPVPPNPKLGHAENFLYMLRGEMPSEIDARAIETDFILTAEHGLNASTFSARVAASTLSDIHSSIVSAIGTLKGVLHGGARKESMIMLEEIGKPERAEEHVLNLIEKKQKIMGFGHRVYKTYDPRARIFKNFSLRLAEHNKNMGWYRIADSIERTVMGEFVKKQGKPIYPNVDFYSGVNYKYLNIPPELAAAVFAVGRTSGWVAHCLEQYSDNRLIRPRAKYTGARNLKL